MNKIEQDTVELAECYAETLDRVLPSNVDKGADDLIGVHKINHFSFLVWLDREAWFEGVDQLEAISMALGAKPLTILTNRHVMLSDEEWLDYLGPDLDCYLFAGTHFDLLEWHKKDRQPGDRYRIEVKPANLSVTYP